MPRTTRFVTPGMLTAIALAAAGCASTGPTASTATTATAAPSASAAPAGTAGAAPTARAAATPPGAPSATPPAPGASTPPGAAAARPAAPPTPGAPPPFAEVTREAKRSEGYLPLWTKEERTWLEVPADLLDKPMLLSHSLASGLGHSFMFPGLMGKEHVVVFKRFGNTVQLVARNLHPRAPAGTPMERAVSESYSDSLLASAPLAAAPHPERKSLLVDANALLGGDIQGMQTQAEAFFRLPFAIDRANTTIDRARATAEFTAVTVRQHFAVPRLPAPPVAAPGAPPPNPAALPQPPRRVPDARSFFLSMAYTLSPLPAVPMQPRMADPRVGFFTDPWLDFGNDAMGDSRVHAINRWRLEKKDPNAEVSEPVRPIRVVMDRNIPEKWRAALRDGALEWNKAFERAGFRNAIVVEQQPADADWTVFEGPGILALRWFAIEGPGATAVGPSQTDPRTGEILRGAAIIPENWARLFRTSAGEVVPRLAASEGLAGNGVGEWAPASMARHAALPGDFAARYIACAASDAMLAEAEFGLELLQARGDIDPNSPQAEQYIRDSLKDVTMHEVGHALGLRHNFRASTGVTFAQLRDKDFVAKRGVSNSVMDYNALNTPLAGEAVTNYHQTTLGAYDLWAIEYGYKPFPAGQESAGLARIAGQAATDPNLSYATDEDVITAIDPLVNQRDLGEDPLAYAERNLKLARELLERTQARTLKPDDDLTLNRRNLERALARIGASVPFLGKYVGGVYTARALAGSNQDLLVPVPAAQQRKALDVLLGEIFSSKSLKLDPVFMRRLGIEQPERLFAVSAGARPSMDFSLSSALAGIQRAALDGLMSDGIAQRLADAETKVADATTLMSYAEVQDRLAKSVWSELKAGGAGRNVDSMRRNLQREHVKRLAGSLVRPSGTAVADVRAVHRIVAVEVEAELRRALATGGLNAATRAHLAEQQAMLAEALKAPLVKQGV
jgi:hypothetical protein